ncbi:MAG: hypothetical protein NC253_03880 [Ruminococcus sp.]|nr:hypothetical protein [Ruminococcus sp.]MCM1480381.1 hypothetical protein [Muribaculaceae bacterium]
MFKINVSELCWINDSADDPEDLCLHGHAEVYIGTQKLEYKACVSSSALYMLKSLSENHIIYKSNQMLPCCGFFLIADENLENVDICGCPFGIDWSVIHEVENVKLVLDDGTEEIVPMADYTKEVLAFADKIEEFYNSCSPKIMPKDEFDRNGYIAFWNEWHRRRNVCK